MRHKVTIAIIAMALIGCSGSVSSPIASHQPFDADTTARIDAALNELVSSGQMVGAVVEIDFPGRGFYRRSLGSGKMDGGTTTPINLNSTFRIGSNTKAFTGTVIQQMIDEGKLTLTETLAEALAGFTLHRPIPNADKITIKQLMNMTTGLVNYSDIDAFNQILWDTPERDLTRDELLDLSFDHPGKFDEKGVNFEPGTEYEYSNTNTVLLGMIIENKLKMSVATAFKLRIYDRLGMTHTSWPQTHALPKPFATGYTDDTRDRTIVNATNYSPTWANSAGQLISNLDDMHIWARALGTGALISPTMKAAREEWVTGIPGATGSYGLAIGKAGGWLHHQGSMPGYNTMAMYLPAYDGTLVVLCNSNIPYGAVGPAAKGFVAISNIVSPDYSPGATPPEE